MEQANKAKGEAYLGPAILTFQKSTERREVIHLVREQKLNKT